MLKNYIKIAFRNFAHNRTFVLLNILGMGMALAICIVAWLNFDYHNSYDENNLNIESIYRINTDMNVDGNLERYGLAPIPLAYLSKDISDIDHVVRILSKTGSASIEGQLFDLRMGFLDPSFTDVFSIDIIHGSADVLKSPNSILISDKSSELFFGKENAIGEVITYIDGGIQKDFLVEGIYKSLPNNSSFQFNGIASFEGSMAHYRVQENDNERLISTFLSINDPQSISKIEELFEDYGFEQRAMDDELSWARYYLDPLRGMAKRATREDITGPLRETLPWPITVIPMVISFLILLIAGFTFTNTFIAFSSQRLKEIGVRKVLGGRKKQLVVQFLTESVLLCILSLVISIPLAIFLVAEFNQLLPQLNLDVNLNYNLDFFIFLVLLLIVTGIVAGSYPAFYITSFQPSQILKGSIKYGDASRFSKILLATQLSFSVLAISSVIIFYQNANYQNDIDFGFDLDKTVVVRFTGGISEYNLLKSELNKNPKIEAITGAGHHVGRNYYGTKVKYETSEFDIIAMDVGDNYIPIMELELVDGRDFLVDKESDFDEAVIINESFVDFMKWDDAIGKHFIENDTNNYYVIGVVKDFYFDSFESRIQPMWLNYSRPEDFRYLVAKTTSSHQQQLVEEVKIAWKEVIGNNEYDIKSGDHAKYSGTAINALFLKVFGFMGGAATILSLVGLYGLISLNISGRMKEIGIHRVLGASTLKIIRTVNRTYVTILLSSILIGAAISFYLIPLMMSSFWSAHVQPGWSMFLASGAIMMSVSVFTVGYQVISAARQNPVNLLKDE